MNKSKFAQIDPFGFREYDARWLYPKDINAEGIANVGRGLGTQITTKIRTDDNEWVDINITISRNNHIHTTAVTKNLINVNINISICILRIRVRFLNLHRPP